MLAQVRLLAAVAEDEAEALLPRGTTSLRIQGVAVGTLHGYVCFVMLSQLIRFLEPVTLVLQVLDTIVIFCLVIIRDLTVTAINSSFRTCLQMLLKLTVGDLLAALACYLSVWTIL